MQSGIEETVTIENQAYVFSLCRKAETMGPVAVDHWWMQTTEVYNQRGRRQQNGNYQNLTEAFWALCRRGGTQHEPDIQESYLLSIILPFARSQGSRRIFADAYLMSGGKALRSDRQLAVAELEQMIQASKRESLTPLEFQRRTGDVLGQLEVTEDEEQCYKDFCDVFFSSARAVLAMDVAEGVRTAVAEWRRLMRSVGRRGGQALQKRILDMLSYEARAALHRCYSAVWDMLLLPHLQQKYALSPESMAFLKFWHLEDVSESNLGEVSYFHLFHGHVFALHPACGEFLRTAGGRELVGTWLVQPSVETFGQLLHGLYVAAFHYHGHREQAASERRKQPQSMGDVDLVDLE